MKALASSFKLVGKSEERLCGGADAQVGVWKISEYSTDSAGTKTDSFIYLEFTVGWRVVVEKKRLRRLMGGILLVMLRILYFIMDIKGAIEESWVSYMMEYFCDSTVEDWLEEAGRLLQ